MKNYSKAEAIQIITQSAAAYDLYLCGNQFLIAIQQEKEPKFTIVGFQPTNFKHLTGVITKDAPSTFYEKALSHKLSPSDFEFDKIGNTQRKLAVLPALPKLLYGQALHGFFNRSGISIDADYIVGNQKPLKVSLAFRYGKKFDHPVSLYCEDIRKMTFKVSAVLAVWRKQFEADRFEENTYSAKGVNADQILSLWLDKSLK